ncbi:hypothetical protein KSS87_022519 [Heliosperma pusillum]|nr:hypothetical protein KSS87_022519 [Heliosperma pusillum]
MVGNKMTKQNVVMSGMMNKIETVWQKPPAIPGKIIGVNERQMMKELDINGGGLITSWVESMRASSPTHLNSTPLSHHLPIMRNTVRKLARYFPTAIVSGRCRDKVYNFVRLAELYYAGSHGMDIKGPTKGVLYQPASEFLPTMDEVYNTLLVKTKPILGAKVEHNKFCLSVHFRCVDEKKWTELAHEVRSVLKKYPKLRLTQGRKVLEIRPTIKWDKGKALEFLLESFGLSNCSDAFPVYIGDDRTDEDAFKVLQDRGHGFGILVSKIAKETNASYYLEGPSEVMNFLQRLVKWKRLTLRRQFTL